MFMAQLDTTHSNADIKELAHEIERYLRERGQAADTIEGITRWWLMRQRLQEAQKNVAQAMEFLSIQGLVKIRKLPDGAVLYTSNQEGNLIDTQLQDSEEN
jgi:FAD/FMN-containing dehydrogenase